ncbi:MAG: hypothetical protein ACREQZ_14025 [Woeseiaceae bacterium]
MTIDQATLELIHADIDGALDEAGKRHIARVLENDGVARQLHRELRALCSTLDAVEELEPPSTLRRTVMESLRQQRTATGPSLLARLFAAPTLRYATAFVAGVLMTMSLISSDRASRSTFDDLTGLVGTMAEPSSAGTAQSRIVLSRSDIAGKVSLYRTGTLLILDFDVTTKRAIDVVTRYPGRELWFNGFAQREDGGTTLSSEPGAVTLHIDGQGRYAVYLRHDGRRGGTLELRFLASGSLVHRAELAFGAGA